MCAKNTVISTLKFKIKDKYARGFSQRVYEVNQVWNTANALTSEYLWIAAPDIGYIKCNASELPKKTNSDLQVMLQKVTSSI